MLKLLKIKDIIPNDYNFKIKTARQMKELEHSISTLGMIGHNVIVDSNNNIITGQNIYRVAIKLGYTELECEVWDTKTPEELNIIDNVSAERSKWNNKLLQSEINKVGVSSFSGYDMSYLKPTEKVVSLKKDKPLKEITCPTCHLRFKLKK